MRTLWKCTVCSPLTYWIIWQRTHWTYSVCHIFTYLLRSNALKVESAILIKYTFCQIQQISPHGLLAVYSVCVLKRNLVFIRSTGFVNGHVSTVALSEPHNTTLANQQQGAFMLVHRTGKSSEQLSVWGHDILLSPAPIEWWRRAGKQERERLWPIHIESVFA